MSNSARLTINGALMARPDLFDSASFPDRLDREILTDTIILECGDLGLYYTDPDYMAQAVRAWSRRRIRIWDEMLDSTEYQYNPIWNKDGTIRETRTDTRKRTGSGDSEGSDDLTHGHKIDEDTETTGQVSGYNSEGWSNRDKTTGDSTETHSGTDKSKSKNTYTTQDDEDAQYDLTRVEQGNIGVTSTQQLIREQRDVIDYDVYGIIADEFKAFFCVLIY